jgi:hypothetical protein
VSVAHTFLFAVGNSRTTWGTLPDLPGVARDVDKVFDALVEGGPGFGLADRLRSVKLLDKGACEVRERWQQFIDAVEVDALVVFYFAGHGALAGAHDLRLLLADSEHRRKDESTLSVRQVIQALENKCIAEWAVILDCCESGEVPRDMAIQGARNRTNRGSLIVCATSSGSAWETPEHGGRFTSRLTEAIQTGSCMPPGTEFVDILHAARWATDKLPESRPLIDTCGNAAFRVARIPTTLVEIGRPPQSEVPSLRNAPQRVVSKFSLDSAADEVVPQQRIAQASDPSRILEHHSRPSAPLVRYRRAAAASVVLHVGLALHPGYGIPVVVLLFLTLPSVRVLLDRKDHRWIRIVHWIWVGLWLLPGAVALKEIVKSKVDDLDGVFVGLFAAIAIGLYANIAYLRCPRS